jgi:hypothetical protein
VGLKDASESIPPSSNSGSCQGRAKGKPRGGQRWFPSGWGNTQHPPSDQCFCSSTSSSVPCSDTSLGDLWGADQRATQVSFEGLTGAIPMGTCSVGSQPSQGGHQGPAFVFSPHPPNFTQQDGVQGWQPLRGLWDAWKLALQDHLVLWGCVGVESLVKPFSSQRPLPCSREPTDKGHREAAQRCRNVCKF